MTQAQLLAIKNHDASFDGIFFCGYKTKRTFCRPSCSVHSFDPADLIVFRTYDEGIQAGFQPCGVCRPGLSVPRGAKAELAARAKDYIEEHSAEKFSLELIAKSLYVDKIYLSKCFKAVTGGTLLSYHNQVRCEKACELLQKEPQLSMELIADRVGFVTASHFARMFKCFYHCTPSEYRKEHTK